jgi:hypothetical protein
VRRDIGDRVEEKRLAERWSGSQDEQGRRGAENKVGGDGKS